MQCGLFRSDEGRGIPQAFPGPWANSHCENLSNRNVVPLAACANGTIDYDTQSALSLQQLLQNVLDAS
jgi:hypothetical protein